MNGLDEIGQTRNPRYEEQAFAMPGGTSEGSPSATPARSQREKRDEDWWTAASVQQVRAEEPREMTKRRSLLL